MNPSQILALSCGLAAALPHVQAQNFQADFNDGSDAGWARYTPLSAFGVGSSFTFPAGGYHIGSDGSPAPGVFGPARAGSFRNDVNVTDFHVGYDLVGWGTTPQFAGAFTRVTTPGLGTLNGYAMGYDFSVDRLFISLLTGESVKKVIAASGVIPLDTAKSYRLEFTGTGSTLGGNIVDLSNGSVLASISGNDATYASGIFGLGVAAQSSTAGVGAAVTFDNVSVTPEPGTWALLGTGAIVLGLFGRRPRSGDTAAK